MSRRVRRVAAIVIASIGALIGCSKPGPSPSPSPSAAALPTIDVSLADGIAEQSIQSIRSAGNPSERTLVLESPFELRFLDDAGTPVLRVSGSLAMIDRSADLATTRLSLVHSDALTRRELVNAMSTMRDWFAERTAPRDAIMASRAQQWLDLGAAGPIPSVILDWQSADGLSSFQILESFDDARPGIIAWESIPQ